jgi:hypothetical protein
VPCINPHNSRPISADEVHIRVYIRREEGKKNRLLCASGTRNVDIQIVSCVHQVQEMWTYKSSPVCIRYKKCGHTNRLLCASGTRNVDIQIVSCVHQVQEIWTYKSSLVCIRYKKCGHTNRLLRASGTRNVRRHFSLGSVIHVGLLVEDSVRLDTKRRVQH